MKCNVCGNSDFSKVIYFNSKKINVIKCRNCGLIFLNPITKQKNFKDDYIALDDNFISYMRKNRTKQHKKDLNIIKKYIKKGKLLDVGSSYGFFLNEARKSGFKVKGIEPSKSAVKFARNNFPQITTIIGEIETQNLNSQYDVVTLFSVLEHAVNPSHVLKKITKIIKKNGIIGIRVPDSDGLIVKIIWLLHNLSFGKINKPSKSLYLINNIYKHFYHFNKNSLSTLLEKYDFKILEHYKENSLDPRNLKDRASAELKNNDLSFLNMWIVREIISLILYLSNIFRKQDEIIIFARKI